MFRGFAFLARRTLFGISALRGRAWVAQSVTTLPPSARDRLAEGTAELMVSLLAAVARAVVQEPPTEAGVTVDQRQPEDEAADG
jgi:hypothetical protein